MLELYYKFFAWRVATNALAPMENKAKIKLEKSDMCTLCGVNREDTFHVFCRCPQARDLWNVMSKTWTMSALDNINNTGPDWLLHLLDQCTVDERLPVLMTMWRTWHVRNEITHHKPAPPTEASRRFLSSYIKTLLEIDAPQV